MSVDKDVLAESKEDREYAARLAKRDEAIAFAKYRKLICERKAKGELK
jgi:hypothetical protein